MDQRDTAILTALAENSKITNSQLAKEIGLSESATLERVRRLEQQGAIQGYSILIDPQCTDRTLEVYMAITLEHQGGEAVEELIAQIRDMDEVLSCSQVLGRFDLIAHVALRDTTALQQLINDKLVVFHIIRRIETLTVINSVKRSTPPVPLTEETEGAGS